MDARSGALDMPGTSWRDRPAVDRGDGVFLAGDMVAAPGLLAEVAWASAIEAGRLALRGGGGHQAGVAPGRLSRALRAPRRRRSGPTRSADDWPCTVTNDGGAIAR